MLKVSQKVTEKIITNQKKIYDGAISPSWDIVSQVKENYSEEVAKRDWEEISKYVFLDEKKKILDLGCGYGYFVAFLRSKKYPAFGCDTDISSVDIAKELLKENGFDPELISYNTNFKLPYPVEFFDFVNLNYVLLYAKDHNKLFREIKRVLKPGGSVYLITPNYQCCYDVNYGLFLIPWLPRFLNKLYLRIMRRKNTDFFETFNFTTKSNLEKMFRQNKFKFTNVGLKEWLENIEKPNFIGRSKAMIRMFGIVELLHFKVILKLLAKIGFYTPLIYVLENEK